MKEHIIQEITQLLFTDRYERYFLPEFGGGGRKLVFSNIDNAQMAVAKIFLTKEIKEWLGHKIDLLDLQISYELQFVEIQITYRLKESKELGKLQLKRGM